MNNRKKAAILFAIILSLGAGAIPALAQSGEGAEAAPYGSPINDRAIYTHAILNQFEGRFGGINSFRWSGEDWTGTDKNKLWLKSEGEVTNGRVEDGQQEIFYDRPISTYFDVQGGLRADIDSALGRSWAAFGIQGLAPDFFEISITGYASSEGHFAGKFEGSYDLLLTQRLIVQPQMEANFYTKSDSARDIGAGLSDIDIGLRLRYEFSRKIAPYIGVTYAGKFGSTADFARLSRNRADNVRLIIGVRTWL